MKKLSGILFFLIFFSQFSKANLRDTVKVSLLLDLKISRLLISHDIGSYQIWMDNKMIVDSCKEFIYQVSLDHDSIAMINENNIVYKGRSVFFKSLEHKSNVKLKAVLPNKALRSYGDDLLIKPGFKGLKIINLVSIEDYVAGVVESEVGTNAPFEYYKVQSILCRTYALSHIRRHETEGFNLCDNVHCQVYFGKQHRNLQIEKATLETKNQVIVDYQNQLIIAAFHSNSGGQTVNCEDIWNHPKSYLKSVPDSFSLKGRNATWQKMYTKQQWYEYFHKKYKMTDTSSCPEIFNYTCKQREIYFNKSYNILLKDMRNDLGLKSTFFNVCLVGDTVTLNGFGYGHGVGLSQEGAIYMSKLGYDYKDIIHYYYKSVNLIDLHMLDFFKE